MRLWKCELFTFLFYKHIYAYQSLNRLGHSTLNFVLRAKAYRESYVCANCGKVHVTFMGKCAGCQEYNTLKSFKATRVISPNSSLRPENNLKSWLDPDGINSSGALTLMSDINVSSIRARISSQSVEVDRVLGGGLVKGSVVLIAGEPGVGKSTLLLQLATNIANSNILIDSLATSAVVYISGEENSEQIASRANRLSMSSSKIFLVCDSNVDSASEIY